MTCRKAMQHGNDWKYGVVAANFYLACCVDAVGVDNAGADSDADDAVVLSTVSSSRRRRHCFLGPTLRRRTAETSLLCTIS